MKDIVFVDVETTGLSPSTDSVIQVAAIRTDHTGRTVKASMNIRVKPTTPMHPKAAEVNGYTKEAWEGAAEPAMAAEQLAAVSQGADFAGHCVWFDHGFCENLMRTNNMRVPWGRRMIDTQTLAHLMWEKNPEMRGTSLQACIQALGGERGPIHDALEDAEWSRKVYVWAMDQAVPVPEAVAS